MITPYPGWPWSDRRLLDLDIEWPPVSFDEWMVLYANYRAKWGDEDSHEGYRVVQPRLQVGTKEFHLREWLYQHEQVKALADKRLVTTDIWDTTGFEDLYAQGEPYVVDHITPLGMEVLSVLSPEDVSPKGAWTFSADELVRAGNRFAKKLAHEHWPMGNPLQFFLEYAANAGDATAELHPTVDGHEELLYTLGNDTWTSFGPGANHELYQVALDLWKRGAKKYLEPHGVNIAKPSKHPYGTAGRRATQRPGPVARILRMSEWREPTIQVVVEHMEPWKGSYFTGAYTYTSSFDIYPNVVGVDPEENSVLAWISVNFPPGEKPEYRMRFRSPYYPPTESSECGEDLLAAALLRAGKPDEKLWKASDHLLELTLEAVEEYEPEGEAYWITHEKLMEALQSELGGERWRGEQR